MSTRAASAQRDLVANADFSVAAHVGAQAASVNQRAHSARLATCGRQALKVRARLANSLAEVFDFADAEKPADDRAFFPRSSTPATYRRGRVSGNRPSTYGAGGATNGPLRLRGNERRRIRHRANRPLRPSPPTSAVGFCAAANSSGTHDRRSRGIRRLGVRVWVGETASARLERSRPLRERAAKQGSTVRPAPQREPVALR